MRGLYAITDPYLTPGQQLLEAVEAALRGGANYLQYRDSLHEAGDRLRIAQELRALCHDYGAWFIINDDVMLTRTVHAHGVHLGRNDMPLAQARELLGTDTLIGVSCYNDLQRARAAQEAGADYVAFGRFFTSRTKPQAQPASLETLRAARKMLTVPVVAIGGITTDNAEIVIDAGADVVAVIQGLFAQPDIEATARQFCQLFQTP